MWPFSKSSNALNSTMLLENETQPEVWPNLFDECREMLEASVLIYALSDIRILARKGKLSTSQLNTDDTDALIDRLLNLPVTVEDVIDVVSKNRENLLQEFGDEDVNFYMSALESILESIRRHGISVATGEAQLTTAHLEFFDDENNMDELVYGIAVNSARKRITVGFRGSVTTKDFITDARSILTSRTNPVKSLSKLTSKQPETIGIHSGFHDYLFGVNRRLDKSRSGGEIKSKFETILGQLGTLLARHPDHRVYVTGHSLGGALSTLFAFELAAAAAVPDSELNLKQPVSCINVASPKVGNMSFRRAFQELEHQGLIRCIRMANYKDLVTLLPDRGSFSCAYIMCCQHNVYRHVGMELKLYPSGKPVISHSQPASIGYTRQFLADYRKQLYHTFALLPTLLCCCCCSHNDFLANHGCQTYMNRLEKFSQLLQTAYLNDLYKNEGSLSATLE